MTIERNRLNVIENQHQGEFKRVLVVCSAGVLRSPTVAWILSNAPFNFNTRAAGSHKSFALIHADEALMTWADEIVFVNPNNLLETKITSTCWYEVVNSGTIMHELNIPDDYDFRDPELIRIATEQLMKVFKINESPSPNQETT